MRCVAVAQTFKPEQLQTADLVKEKISDVTISELLAESTPPAVSPALPPPLPQPRPWGFWATIGFSLGIIVAFLAVQIAVGLVFGLVVAFSGRNELLAGTESNSDGLYWALATCATTPTVVGFSLLFAWLRKGISIKEYLGIKPVTIGILLRWCLILLVFLVLMDQLTTLLKRPIVPDVMVKAYRTAGFPPLFWLAVVVGAPLAEEVFFRGFFFKGVLHSRLGSAGAILLTSLCWASVHLQYDLIDITTIFVLGLLFGLARLKCGSIYPSLMMHALMNLLATFQVAAIAG